MRGEDGRNKVKRGGNRRVERGKCRDQAGVAGKLKKGAMIGGCIDPIGVSECVLPATKGRTGLNINM